MATRVMTPHIGSEPRSIVLLGVNSMVGWSIARRASARADIQLSCFCNPHTRIPARAPWRRLDLCDGVRLAALIAHERPSLIIHCAGICNVEKCEKSPDFAHEINVRGMERLVAAAPPGTRLVYVSSDHVFSGDGGPYTESSPPDPISVYGRTRASAEALLAARRPDGLIARASLWIGPSHDGRVGHLDWLRYRTARGLPMTLVRDEYRSAAWADAAAERTLELALSEISGVRHVVAERAVARPELARYLNRRFAIGARFATVSRSQRPVPHLGRVTLATEYDDALAAPLPGVVPRAAS